MRHTFENALSATVGSCYYDDFRIEYGCIFSLPSCYLHISKKQFDKDSHVPWLIAEDVKTIINRPSTDDNWGEIVFPMRVRNLFDTRCKNTFKSLVKIMAKCTCAGPTCCLVRVRTDCGDFYVGKGILLNTYFTPYILMTDSLNYPHNIQIYLNPQVFLDPNSITKGIIKYMIPLYTSYNKDIHITASIKQWMFKIPAPPIGKDCSEDINTVMRENISNMCNTIK